MNVSRTIFLKNTKDAKVATTGKLNEFGKDFLNKHFASNIGKKVYREKKVGESGPLPQTVRDKYKTNFENIVLTIMTSKNASVSKIEPVIELELKKPNFEKNTKTSLTSEESSEDYFEKARIFSNNVLYKGQDLNLKFKGEPILLKKNSFLTFADNYDDIDESDVDDTDILESDHKGDVDIVEGLEQDKL